MTAVKIILLIVVFVIAIVALVFHLTRAIVDPADKFMSLLRDGRLQEAYTYTHSKFRNQTAQAAFDELVRTRELDRNVGVSWSQRRIKNGYGKLKGSVLLPGGNRIPMVLLFEKEGDNWRITGIHINPGESPVSDLDSDE